MTIPQKTLTDLSAIKMLITKKKYRPCQDMSIGLFYLYFGEYQYYHFKLRVQNKEFNLLS